MDDSFRGLMQVLLPAVIFEYFKLDSFEKKGEVLHLYLSELNRSPKEYVQDKLESKGFFEEITVQDFPIRGHQVFMHIKRRRWLNKSTGTVVYRNWDLVNEGTRITSEFAAFLKQISQYK
jgi:hypothetical protein